MSGRPANRNKVPQDAEARKTGTDWVNSAYVVAALCLFGLALVEIVEIDIPALRWIFVGVIALAGTGAIIMQSKRICPGCGAAYGYHFRIVNAGKCRQCGAEFPNWRPGRDETD
ncbi:MAG: hypothetical protein VX871_07585 [Pseudomonadota bacterium]|nr:hypothetical protein [Pseudomonadota bacterium]